MEEELQVEEIEVKEEEMMVEVATEVPALAEVVRLSKGVAQRDERMSDQIAALSFLAFV